MTLNIRQLAAFAAGSWLLALSPAAATEEKTMERTITVSASGSVTAEPDQARINTGVVSEAATAIEALNKNTEANAPQMAANGKPHDNVSFSPTTCP